MYKVKIKKIAVSSESGDKVIVASCFLVDASGIAFKNSNNEVDMFIIRAPKSSIPTSGYFLYLSGLAQAEIAFKYTQTLPARSVHNSPYLVLSEANIKRLFIGLTVSGVGLATSKTLNSIISPTQVLLSGNVNLQFSGNTTAPTLAATGDTTIGTTVISNLSSTVGIVAGMFISGNGLPIGTTVLAINSATEIIVTQNALASNIGTTFTFSTVEESEYISNLIPAIFTESYEGLGITGANIPRDTTIAETVSSSRIRLLNNATGSGTASTFTVDGNSQYTFSAGSLTIDYSELQNIVDIIDFTEL